MYASFFALRELPFNNTPDPRFFFSTPDHEEALASLIYAINEGKGFVLLTGEVGSGKTLITRLMLRHFGDTIEFAHISNTQISAHDLLQSVCTEFNIDYPPGASSAKLIRVLQDFLLTGFGTNKPVVLMLDEAQALSHEAFEQVRMIGNMEADDAKLLQIIIVGQTELRDRFENANMRQLRQRMFRCFHLNALSREQTRGYIHHRLSVAGSSHAEEVFDVAAIQAVFEFSQGLPRLINAACDNAMLSAYAADRKTIDGESARQAIMQMMSVSRGCPHPGTGPLRMPLGWTEEGTAPGNQPGHVPRHVGGQEDRQGADHTGQSWGGYSWPLPQDAEWLVRQQLQRAAVEAQHICREATWKLSREVEDLAFDTRRRLAEESRCLGNRHSRSPAESAAHPVPENSQKPAHDLRTRPQDHDDGREAHPALDRLVQTSERSLEMEANPRALVEQAEAADGQTPSDVGQSRRLMKIVRRLLQETKSATNEAGELLTSAQAARTTAEQAMVHLAKQSARTGRLAVALRGTLGKIEDRVKNVNHATARRTTFGPSTQAPTETQQQRSPGVTAGLDGQADDTRNHSDHAPAPTGTRLDLTLRGRDSQTPAAQTSASRPWRLIREVRALSDLIDQTRQGSLQHV